MPSENAEYRLYRSAFKKEGCAKRLEDNNVDPKIIAELRQSALQDKKAAETTTKFRYYGLRRSSIVQTPKKINFDDDEDDIPF